MTPLVEARAIALPGRLAPTDLRLIGGELTAVIGPNGGGKTSLLRALAGVEESGGSVAIGGEEIGILAPQRRQALLSFLPASREIAWPISVRDVIALTACDRQLVDTVMDELELARLADRAIGSLSTGERARALLARALAARPKLLLLDEPLSNLDPYWVLRGLDVIASAVRSSGAAALVAVHDLGLIGRFDRILGLSGGRILFDERPGPLLEGPAIGRLFGVERIGFDWAIRQTEGPRSLP